MRAIIVGVALWTAISSTSAQAGDVVGHGASSCATWISDQNDRTDALFDEIWVAGYLSGYARHNFNSKIIDLPDPAASRHYAAL